MRPFPLSVLVTLLVLTTVIACPAATVGNSLIGDYTAPNPRIDFTAFLVQAENAQVVRERSRLSEDKFIELSRQPGVVILDARSSDKFALLHVTGAINLPFADISEPSLANTLPDKNQVILIYCNNNFEKAPLAFASKRMEASLNICERTTMSTRNLKSAFV